MNTEDFRDKRRVGVVARGYGVLVTIETIEGEPLGDIHLPAPAALLLAQRITEAARNAGGRQKYCPTCQILKNRHEFYSDHSRSDGVSGECRVCKSARNRIQARKRAQEKARRAA